MGGNKLIEIVGVRLKKLGKIVFYTSFGIELEKGDKVIVDATNGETLR